MNRYAALLRGINVGGLELIKMVQLAQIFLRPASERYLHCSGSVFLVPPANGSALTGKSKRHCKRRWVMK